MAGLDATLHRAPLAHRGVPRPRRPVPRVHGGRRAPATLGGGAVTADTIAGAMCFYLLLGVIWALIDACSSWLIRGRFSMEATAELGDRRAPLAGSRTALPEPGHPLNPGLWRHPAGHAAGPDARGPRSHHRPALPGGAHRAAGRPRGSAIEPRRLSESCRTSSSGGLWPAGVT